MERKGDLTLNKVDPIANVRMDCLNAEMMIEYFEMLKAVMIKHYFLRGQATMSYGFRE